MPVFDHPLQDATTAATLNRQLEHRSADEIVQWATQEFRGQIALTCSFGGPSGMVLLDLALRHDRDIPVLVLDTGLLFPETDALVIAIEQHYGISVQRVRPSLTLAQQANLHGAELYNHNPDQCCKIRKVEPLNQALKPFGAWMTALRRDQNPTRANTPIASWNERQQLVKICPLAQWSERETWRYIHANGVPYNSLLDNGFTSLGCTPCTQRPLSADDARSGRWVGFAKTECGLHL